MGRKKLKQVTEESENDSNVESDEEFQKKIKKKKYADPTEMYCDVMECMDEFKTDMMNVKKKEESTTLPWIEKFRPKSLDDIISHENIIYTLNKFVEKQQLPHLIFRGPPGTGKTSTIMACARKLYGNKYGTMVLDLNASEERGIDAIRGKVTEFVSTKGIFLGVNEATFKLVILDEADAMTPDAQSALVSVMEKHTLNARFCLICNYVQKIKPAIQSRCVIFKFAPLSKENIKKKLFETCKNIGLNLTETGANEILKISKGDMRKVLNILQATSMSYKLINNVNVSNCVGYPLTTDINEIYNHLRNDSFVVAYEKIKNIVYKNGYSISDVITELTTLLIEKQKTTEIKNLTTILLNMREIEMNLTSCTNECTQISALVGAFKI